MSLPPAGLRLCIEAVLEHTLDPEHVRLNLQVHSRCSLIISDQVSRLENVSCSGGALHPGSL